MADMTSIRQLLKRSPLAVRTYQALRRSTSGAQAQLSAPLPLAPGGQGPEVVEVETTDQPDLVVSQSSIQTDFDIYHQLPPHVLYTYRDKQAVVNDALRAYTAVPVEDEPSGLSTDPIRILNFFQLIEAANRLPAGDYLELGSHRGFSTRVIHRFMDPNMTLYAFDTF
jgi:hypothetical protein